MSDTPNYVEYRPPADGVAPPYWREGMKVLGFRPYYTPDWRELSIEPSWGASYVYQVPSESLTAPNEDAKDVKPQDPRRSVQEALAILRGYSPDELAKHGITLSEPKDGFEAVAAEAYRKFRLNCALDGKNHAEADFWRAQKGVPANKDFKAFLIAASFIRERVVLNEGV